ncbi:MAG: PAS domain S-box protein [Deltaproteobacteria bacterium]|nr:PAS domain S-box protein [Deltaproteobacteria bacterium]
MEPRASRLKTYLWILMILWTGVVLGLFLSDSRHLAHTVKDLAIAEARAYLNKDQASRLWAASHGGVYVPISEKTQPNPFLNHLPERDIRTPSGKALTLMNPAYMIRQIMEQYAELHGVRGRITGLKHFSEATAPDDWEKFALMTFKGGDEEQLEFSEIEGAPFLRVMRSLATEPDCLKCHAHQGYQVGDVRGGVSVSVPMASYLSYAAQDMKVHGFSYALLWLAGLGGAIWAERKLARSMQARDRAEEQLRLSQKNYMAVVANSLTGIYINQDKIVRFANARFAEIHGYAPNEIVGVNVLDLVHPEDRNFVEELGERRLKGENVVNEYEIRCITRDGKTIWVQRRNTLIEYDGAPAILGNAIDITRQKEVEETLRASEEQLKKLSARLLRQQEIEKRDIARGMHEDIAQCLSAIKLRVEYVLDELGDEGPDSRMDALRPIVSDVQQSVRSIRRMTQNLRPLLLDNMGVGSAVSWICRETAKARSGLRIEQHIGVEESRIPDDLKIVVFRTIEDVLKSVSRYGKTGLVEIVLQVVEDLIVLTIKAPITCELQDLSIPAGIPFDYLDIQKLKGRVESCGGAFKFEGLSESVKTLVACWPLAHDRH